MNAYTIEDRSTITRRRYAIIIGDMATCITVADYDAIKRHETEIETLTVKINACTDTGEKKQLVKRRGTVRGMLTRKVNFCVNSYPSEKIESVLVVECQIADSISIEYDADTDCVDMGMVAPIELSGLAWVIASDKIELAETRHHLVHDDCVDPTVVAHTIELIERRIARNEELLKRVTTCETDPISSANEGIKLLQQCVEEMGASDALAQKSSERVTNTNTPQRPFSATILSSVLSHTDMPLLLEAMRDHPEVFATADCKDIGESIQCIHRAHDGTQYDIFAVCQRYDWTIQVTRLDHAIDTRPFSFDNDAIALANAMLDIRDAGRTQYMPIIRCDSSDWGSRINRNKRIHHAIRYQRNGLDVVFRVLYTTGKRPIVNIVDMY